MVLALRLQYPLFQPKYKPKHNTMLLSVRDPQTLSLLNIYIQEFCIHFVRIILGLVFAFRVFASPILTPVKRSIHFMRRKQITQCSLRNIQLPFTTINYQQRRFKEKQTRIIQPNKVLMQRLNSVCHRCHHTSPETRRLFARASLGQFLDRSRASRTGLRWQWTVVRRLWPSRT